MDKTVSAESPCCASSADKHHHTESSCCGSATGEKRAAEPCSGGCGCGSHSGPADVSAESTGCGCSSSGTAKIQPESSGCGCGDSCSSGEPDHDNEHSIVRLSAAAVAAFASEAGSWSGWPVGLVAALALAALALSGTSTFRAGWSGIRRLQFNMQGLMTLAVGGAIIIGEWPEAAMVMVLYHLAEYLEGRAVSRARRSVRELLELAPVSASVLRGDQWQQVHPDDVQVGERIRVLAGERLPLDGEVISGSSSVNQAAITGESALVDKAAGDQVYAGSLNESGTLEYRAETTADGTVLSQIITMVETAQQEKTPVQRWVDRFAQFYTPFILIIAVAVAFIPPLLGYGSWMEWFYRGLVMLIIGCPCALVLSTPITLVSALSLSARQGILVRSSSAVETAGTIGTFAFDKTGTLTTGKPELEEIRVLNNIEAVNSQALAHALTAHSSHPLSQVIYRGTEPCGQLALENIQNLPGSGISAELQSQKLALLRPGLVQLPDTVAAAVTELQQQGKTLVILTLDEQPLLMFVLSDSIKPGTADVLRPLADRGISLVMLTGDSPGAAAGVAAATGIKQVRASLLPADKKAEIDRLRQSAPVAMVGDGINDAPAMAAADLSIAMGVLGTDVAVQTADVALMRDDLSRIPVYLDICAAARKNMKQNFAIALGLKALFLVLSLMGLATLWMAVFADVGASLLVVANALRLLGMPFPGMEKS